MVIYSFGLPEPADAGPYHAHLVGLLSEAPRNFGDWTGRDQEVQPSAIELLRPNLIISRQYRNQQTGERASFMLVQCKDARDMNGHWPPNCYPAGGDVYVDSWPKTWTLSDQALPGREFRFEQSNGHRRVVSNFLIIPDGRVSADMSDVVEAAGNYGLRYFGAAQVQVLTPDRMGDERREAVVQEFLAAYRPLIESIRYGRP